MHVFYSVWAVLTGLWLLFLSYRSYRFSREIFPLESGPSEQTAAWPRISLIVPACNEAQTIEPAARTLLKMNYPNLEIVIINDRSTDQTGEIIEKLAKEDTRIRAVHIAHLPAGWLGKINALNEGIKKATGDWLLLADADVHFSQTALRKAVIHANQNEIDFLTVIPDIQGKGLGLRAMVAQFYHQGSCFLNLRQLNNPKNSLCFGIGAFNLLRRTVYDRSEQLTWMKMEVVDDSGIALVMRRAGGKVDLVSGKNEIKLVWYPTLGSLLRGIEKNAFAICQYSLPVLFGFLIANIVTFLGFTLIPILSGSATVMSFAAACLSMLVLMVRKKLRKNMKVDVGILLLFPVTMFCLPFFHLRASILTYWRGGIHWRNTFYSLRDLRAEQRVRFIDMVFTRQTFSVRPAAARGVFAATGSGDLFRSRLRRRPPGSQLRPHDLRYPEISI